jgi:hypothetical protein
MSRRPFVRSCAALALLLAPGFARAQASHIWVGPHPVCTAAGIPNAWHCPQNWSDQTVPNSGSTVSIGASFLDGQMSGSVQSLSLFGTDFRTQGSLSVTSFDWDGGKIGINGTITVTGNGALRGGSMELGLSTVPTTTLAVAPSAVVNWTGGDVRFVNGAIDNKGRFNVQTDARLIEAAGLDRFINRSTGTVARTAGTLTAAFGVNVTNEGGAFDVRTGTLAFTLGGTFDGGTYAAAVGARLLFGGPLRFMLSGTLTGEPAGFVGTDPVAANSGGRLTVPAAATLDISGTGFQWTSDIILGPGTLTNAGLLVVSGATMKRLSGGTLRNTGDVFWEGGGPVSVSNGRIENAGVFNLLSDGLALSAGGGSFSFVNQEGGFLIGLGTGTTTTLVGIPVTNQPGAIIDAQTGTLEFTQTLDHQEDALVRGASTLDVPGGTLMTNAGNTSPTGIGDEDGTGRLTWAGNFNPTATALLLINLDGTTAGTDYDQLAVTGNATLRGTLDLQHGTGFSPPVGTSFTVLTAASVSGTFAAVQVPNDYTYSVAYNPTSVVATVTAQPTFDIIAVATTPLTVAPGGSVSFDVAVLNNTPNPATGDFWFTAQPGGQGLIVSRTVPGNDHVIFPYRQPIPANAPPGTIITYRLHIGQFPNNSMDFEEFTIEIEGGSLAVAGEPASWAAGEAAGWPGEGVAPEAASAGPALPSAYALHAAYPNPLDRATTLRFDLPETAHVRLAVYDVLGRAVAVLVDGEREAGRHEATFDGAPLPSGTYLVRLEAEGAVQMQRVTVVR